MMLSARPMVTPVQLKTSLSGAVIRPRDCSVEFTSPRSPRMASQPKTRTTPDTSIGMIATTASRPRKRESVRNRKRETG